MAMDLLLRGNTALNIEEIVLTNLEAVTNSRLRVDPHEARQLEDVKIPRYLDDGNVEDWAKTLSCGFCKTNLSLGDRGVIQSPDYPQAYTANVDCLWLLETANLEDRIYLDCDSVELGNTSIPTF